MTEKFPINRWGWITSIDTEFTPIEIASPNRYGEFIQIANQGSVEITLRAPYRAELMDALYRFARNGRSPTWTEEWMCLYCASPNDLLITHCSQCGGPRNWILG